MEGLFQPLEDAIRLHLPSAIMGQAAITDEERKLMDCLSYHRTPGFYICHQSWEINEYDMNIAITDPTKENEQMVKDEPA